MSHMDLLEEANRRGGGCSRTGAESTEKRVIRWARWARGGGGGGEARSRGALWEGSKQHVGPRREEGEIRYKCVEEKVESCCLAAPTKFCLVPVPKSLERSVGGKRINVNGGDANRLWKP